MVRTSPTHQREDYKAPASDHIPFPLRCVLEIIPPSLYPGVGIQVFEPPSSSLWRRYSGGTPQPIISGVGILNIAFPTSGKQALERSSISPPISWTLAGTLFPCRYYTLHTLANKRLLTPLQSRGRIFCKISPSKFRSSEMLVGVIQSRTTAVSNR